MQGQVVSLSTRISVRLCATGGKALLLGTWSDTTRPVDLAVVLPGGFHLALALQNSPLQQGFERVYFGIDLRVAKGWRASTRGDNEIHAWICKTQTKLHNGLLNRKADESSSRMLPTSEESLDW